MVDYKDRDTVTDPIVWGNRARYADHSCRPNAGIYTRRLAGQTIQVVVIYAGRRIPPGEEITVNYRWKGTDEGLPFVCFCNTPNCSVLL